MYYVVCNFARTVCAEVLLALLIHNFCQFKYIGASHSRKPPHKTWTISITRPYSTTLLLAAISRICPPSGVSFHFKLWEGRHSQGLQTLTMSSKRLQELQTGLNYLLSAHQSLFFFFLNNFYDSRPDMSQQAQKGPIFAAQTSFFKLLIL